MFAIMQHEFGSAETLRGETVPDPVPAVGQVRIAVAAAGVHLLDTSLREGRPGPFGRPDLPMTPGREVAGVVDAVGDGVDRSWLGKRVAAHLGMASGGYAELAVREVEAIHKIPADVSEREAVAMIGTGRTAMGILDSVPVHTDDVVLVTAAAGGIGNLLVQAAVNAGAVVVGVAGGPDKVKRVRSLAGDVTAVDYSDPDWPQTVRNRLDGRDVTVAFDGVGGEAGRTVFDLLGVGARMALFGWSAGCPFELSMTELFDRCLTVSVTLGPSMMKRPGGLRALEAEALAEAGRRRLIPFTQSFALAEAGRAQAALESRQTIGKVVLIP